MSIGCGVVKIHEKIGTVNKVDVTVVEVVVELHQTKDDLWSTTIISDCWGSRKEDTIISKDKWSVEKYKLGYTWQE